MTKKKYKNFIWEFAWIFSKDNVINNFYRLLEACAIYSKKNQNNFPIFELNNNFSFLYYFKHGLFEIEILITRYLDLQIDYYWQKR